MKTAFILFFIILLYSVSAKAQQTINSLNVKDLNVNGNIQVISTTEASTPCPEMTEAQRDAIPSPVLGNCVTNSDTLALNVYNGTIWKAAGGGGVNQWLTSTGYNVDDVVIESFKFYVCLIAHTSGTFATDLAGLNWQEVSPGLTGVISMANGGTDKALTSSLGGVVYTDANSMEVLGAGTSGQELQSNGAAAPTWVNKSISGKAQNKTVVTAEELQVPNNQLTQTDTNKYLIATGNKNILDNPSFEHSTFSTSWTNSAGTFTQETSVLLDGKASAKEVLSAQTMSLTQSSTLYASQFADGVQGLAMCRVKSDVALSVCSIQAGTVSTTNCVTTKTDSKWGLYKIPFILGATSNGVSVASSGSVTGTVYVDDCFVGAVDLKQDVDQSRIAGESYFAGTSSCTWSRTSTTIGAFTTTAACPGPTVSYSSMGTWATTDSDLPRQSITGLPAGTYLATFNVFSAMGGSGSAAYAINDGTTTCTAMAGNSDTISSPTTVRCIFNYTTAGNRAFELYTATSANANTINNGVTTPAIASKFTLEYFGSAQLYSAQCGNNCIDDFKASITSANVVSTQTGAWVTSGTWSPTGTLTVVVPSGVFTVVPPCNANGDSALYAMNYDRASSTTTSLVFSAKRFDSNVAVNANASISCGKTGADFVATRTLQATFNEAVTTKGITKPSLSSASVSASEVITEDESVFLSSCTNADPSVCTLTTSFFTADPKCWANPIVAGTIAEVTGDTTTTVTVDRTDASTAFTLFCHGAR